MALVSSIKVEHVRPLLSVWLITLHTLTDVALIRQCTHLKILPTRFHKS
jgi:hypothetical protein